MAKLLTLMWRAALPAIAAPMETSTGRPAGTAGLMGTRGPCEGATWDAWVTGATGPAAHATSRQSARAFAACQRG